ncbi:MAG: thioesterase family protein [Ignavibacterium sp.]|jgi:YbgC/YbaW family acyl-CoA thioester hydrolase|nr:thioesterase family protein [Ignavibacterium sp.]
MHELKRKINFFDCDPAGIIFYSRIFEFCHSAYEEMISSFNLKENFWMNENYVVPIIHSESEYVKPIKYGDEISIIVQVSQLRDSSFELMYTIKRGKTLCSHVKTVHVFVDKKNWKKKEICNDLKEGLKRHVI